MLDSSDFEFLDSVPNVEALLDRIRALTATKGTTPEAQREKIRLLAEGGMTEDQARFVLNVILDEPDDDGVSTTY